MSVKDKLDNLLEKVVRVHLYVKLLDTAVEVEGILQQYLSHDYRVMSMDKVSHIKFPASAVAVEDGKPAISNLGDQGFGKVWFIDLLDA